MKNYKKIQNSSKYLISFKHTFNSLAPLVTEIQKKNKVFVINGLIIVNIIQEIQLSDLYPV